MTAQIGSLPKGVSMRGRDTEAQRLGQVRGSKPLQCSMLRDAKRDNEPGKMKSKHVWCTSVNQRQIKGSLDKEQGRRRWAGPVERCHRPWTPCYLVRGQLLLKGPVKNRCLI